MVLFDYASVDEEFDMEEEKDIDMILLMHKIKWIDQAWFGCA
jgi:hypothetical protein